MKKFIAALMFVLLLCCVTAAASAAETTPAVMNGLTVNLPELPVRLEDTRLEEYSNIVILDYAWKFETEKNAALQIRYEIHLEENDLEEYVQSIPVNDEQAEVVRKNGMIYVYGIGEPRETVFLMGRSAFAVCVGKENTVSVMYANDALTDAERLAEAKSVLASVQLTEPVFEEENDESAEFTVSTQEEVEDALRQCRADKPGTIELTCGEELYELLSAENFALTLRLCSENGLDDPGIRYSSSAGIIELSDMTYTDLISYAWVDTMEEAEAAAYRFVSDGLANFTLGCTGEIYTTLVKDGEMYNLLAKLGIDDFDLYSGGSSVVARNMAPYTGEYAVVDDVYRAADQLALWRDARVERCKLVFDKAEYDALTDTDLDLIAFLGGIDGYGRKNPYACSVAYGESNPVEWIDSVSVYCQSEEDVITAIRTLGAQGTKDFRFMMPEDLYETLREDSFARLHELESQAGMSSCEMSYYIGSPIVVYSDAKITADAVMLSSVEETNAYVSECAARQDSGIDLFLTADVYDELMSGYSSFQIGKSSAKIFDLIANAGIADCSWMYNRATHIISMDEVVLYAGSRILQGVLNGTETALNARDRETLTAALSLADACKGATELETLKNIHDALCEGVVYTDDDATDEDDCAIGAILTGEANCDGYADALYLVGNLAGLEVRYQHGDSVKQGLGSMFATHMWNMVRLDGTWRLVDVTWDDQEKDAPIYAWFNIGEDRAALTHVWSREMTVPMDPVTDMSARVETEYIVASPDDIAAAVRDAAAKGADAYSLYLPQDCEAERNEVLAAVREAVRDSFDYMWLDGLNGLMIWR